MNPPGTQDDAAPGAALAQRLGQMISGSWISQMIYVAAELGLADHMIAGPQSVADLAKASGTHEHSLFRLLRALASVGVFAEQPDGRFALTPLAELLRSDVPGTQRPLARMMGDEQYRAWGGLLDCIRTGETAYDRIIGQPIFEFLAEHPAKGQIFDAAMTAIHGRETAAMLDAYDFADVKVLADIGGGNGTLLAQVLDRHPALRAILFDLPGVIERTQANLAAWGLAGRCQTAAGSFFESVPGGADVYLLRHIIHDWDDARSIAILRNCRRALGPGGRVLVVESVIPPGNGPFFGKLLDLTMLAIPGGMERTEEEYRRLFAAAGLQIARIVPTTQEISVIEGVAAN